MVDAFPLGRLFGPNLTKGQGSRTMNYTVADWDRIVRHGLLPDGRAALMPSEDFLLMSDQELADIIAYIQAQPPVDRTMPETELGPLGKVLLATGQMRLTARLPGIHQLTHAEYPPAAMVSVEFGRHLAGVCTGCHKADLTGGPIVGGDPSWPPASNLTPASTGLGAWTYAQFQDAMRLGKRPDGSAIAPPMSILIPYAQQMSETELEAIWMYLQSLSP
jgi:mono/diheme cytochrome c family protein